MNEKEISSFFPILYDVEKDQIYKWCGCGKSKTQPLCDRNDCTQYVMFKAELTETVAFCGCKQTKSPPLCDGSHAKVIMKHLKNKQVGQ